MEFLSDHRISARLVGGECHGAVDLLAPWLPLRLPRTNFPSLFIKKTATPTRGTIIPGADDILDLNWCESRGARRVGGEEVQICL